VPYERLNDFEAKIKTEWYFAFAVKYANKHPELKPGFEVTPQMTTDFKPCSRRSSSSFTDAQIDSARTFIDKALKITLPRTSGAPMVVPGATAAGHRR